MSLKKYIKTNFDYDVSGLTAYVDEQSPDLIVRSVSEAKTLGYITIQEGVKKTEELKLMDDSITYQASGSCALTDGLDAAPPSNALGPIGDEVLDIPC